jgi:hypothetical protein
MLFNFADSDRAPAAGQATDYDVYGLRARWGERAVTAVAVTLALLFVTTVAVLMGLA